MDEEEKEIRCSCNKLLAKITKDGIIKVWCKSCKKEVPLEIESKPSGKSFIGWFLNSSE